MSDANKNARAALDAWAEWIDATQRAEYLRLYYPKQDTTSRHADLHGERADKRTGRAVNAAPVEYASSAEEREAAFASLYARLNVAVCEQVDAYMAELKATAPMSHLCVVAKHRRVIGSISVGVKRNPSGRMVPLTDGDLAEVCIKGALSSMAKRVAFSRHLTLCYQGLAKVLDP